MGAHTFAYDVVDRLTSATHPNLPGESYAYDGVGNRTSSHRASSYSYQPTNRLTVAGPTTHSYDLNGNLISKTDAAGTWFYSWDYENRLVQVTRPDGQVISYKYDALGRRIERAKGGAWTRFSYDGADVVLDRTSDGTTVEYTNGPGIDEKLSLRVNGGAATYFVADHLGSTRALTDASGSVIERADYDSFGNGAASALTRYEYTGREFDTDTGLLYYRARWYDPLAGRFLSEDPIGFAGGPNFYSYVGSNPIRYTDPSGLIHPAWNESPYDRRLHDDPSGGLEVLCQKGRNIPQDIEWLEHSITVRQNEILEFLTRAQSKKGPGPDRGHAKRLAEEILMRQRCNECDDSKPEPVPIVVPDDVSEKDWSQYILRGIAAGGGAYLIYRDVRLVPSLFPVLWRTIPANLAIP